jgi:Leucine-rich repeat (LRR) protein
MNRNELKTIESDIGKLSNLVEFDLEYNKLNDLTKIKFQGLKKLKKLILSFNPELDKLP